MQPNPCARADAIYPGGPDRPCPGGRSSVAFDDDERLGSRNIGVFGTGTHRPARSLSTHQDGGRPSPCKTRFQRGGYPFAGWDLHPLGPRNEFWQALDSSPSLVTASPGRNHHSSFSESSCLAWVGGCVSPAPVVPRSFFMASAATPPPRSRRRRSAPRRRCVLGTWAPPSPRKSTGRGPDRQYVTLLNRLAPPCRPGAPP